MTDPGDHSIAVTFTILLGAVVAVYILRTMREVEQ